MNAGEATESWVAMGCRINYKISSQQELMIFKVSTFILLALAIFLLFSRQVIDKPVEIRESPVHGRGIFARKCFKKGEVIEVAPTIKYNKVDEFTEKSVLTHYDIHYKDAHALPLGYGALYNHADEHNADWHWDEKGDLVIQANKDIQKGKEVFVNYGEQYWSKRSDKQ